MNNEALKSYKNHFNDGIFSYVEKILEDDFLKKFNNQFRPIPNWYDVKIVTFIDNKAVLVINYDTKTNEYEALTWDSYMKNISYPTVFSYETLFKEIDLLKFIKKVKKYLNNLET